MEWDLILVMQLAVAFAVCYLCAGLMEDEKSWLLVIVGLLFSAAVIGNLINLFLISLGNGFVGLGISLLVALVCVLACRSAKNQPTDLWD